MHDFEALWFYISKNDTINDLFLIVLSYRYGNLESIYKNNIAKIVIFPTALVLQLEFLVLVLLLVPISIGQDC